MDHATEVWNDNEYEIGVDAVQVTMTKSLKPQEKIDEEADAKEAAIQSEEKEFESAIALLAAGVASGKLDRSKINNGIQEIVDAL